MKKIIAALSLSILATQFPSIGYAAETSKELIETLSIPDFSVDMAPVPLQSKEKKALELSKKWITKSNMPFMAGNGKLTYVYGASMPTVLAAPLQVSVVEFQRGEYIDTVTIGDTVRWKMKIIHSNGKEYVVFKPTDINIESNAIISTDKRIYHLRLVSTEDNFTPYIGFVYGDEMIAYQRQVSAEKAKQEHFDSYKSDETDKVLSLENLNFNYEVRGKADWKPERIYDDGSKTYIKLPKRTYTSEMPILLVSKGGQTVLVNYRTKKTAMIVDGVFDEIILVLGVGKEKEQINIMRAE